MADLVARARSYKTWFDRTRAAIKGSLGGAYFADKDIQDAMSSLGMFMDIAIHKNGSIAQDIMLSYQQKVLADNSSRNVREETIATRDKLFRVYFPDIKARDCLDVACELMSSNEEFRDTGDGPAALFALHAMDYIVSQIIIGPETRLMMSERNLIQRVIDSKSEQITAEELQSIPHE